MQNPRLFKLKSLKKKEYTHRGRSIILRKFNKFNGTNYGFLIEYEVNGKTYEASKMVQSSYYSEKSVGDTIAVEYLPKKPSIIRLPAGMEDKLISPYAMFLIGLLFAFGGYRMTRPARRVRPTPRRY